MQTSVATQRDHRNEREGKRPLRTSVDLLYDYSFLVVASLAKNGLFLNTRGYYLVSLYLKKTYLFTLKGASLLAQLVKNPPANQET